MKALGLIIALVLAWPTFGLSLVAWAIIIIVQAKKDRDKKDQRAIMSEVISPLFKDRYEDFYEALDIPYLDPSCVSGEMARQCGRHLVNYISHNPNEAALFIKGLKVWTLKGSSELCDPVDAADCEARQGPLGYIHLVAYRGIEALLTNNTLSCFEGIDLPSVKQYLNAHGKSAFLEN